VPCRAERADLLRNLALFVQIARRIDVTRGVSYVASTSPAGPSLFSVAVSGSVFASFRSVCADVPTRLNGARNVQIIGKTRPSAFGF